MLLAVPTIPHADTWIQLNLVRQTNHIWNESSNVAVMCVELTGSAAEGLSHVGRLTIDFSRLFCIPICFFTHWITYSLSEQSSSSANLNVCFDVFSLHCTTLHFVQSQIKCVHIAIHFAELFSVYCKYKNYMRSAIFFLHFVFWLNNDGKNVEGAKENVSWRASKIIQFGPVFELLCERLCERVHCLTGFL